MAKILYIKTSLSSGTPRGSISSSALDYFMQVYTNCNPYDEIIEMDLDAEELLQTPLTSRNLEDIYNPQLPANKYIEQYKAVYKIVISVPMINFSYPAVLKNYFDRLLIKGKSFTIDSRTLELVTLLPRVRVQIITTQGADWGYAFAHLGDSIKGVFDFLGANVEDIIEIIAVNTPKKKKLSAANVVSMHQEALKLAAVKFAAAKSYNCQYNNN